MHNEEDRDDNYLDQWIFNHCNANRVNELLEVWEKNEDFSKGGSEIAGIIDAGYESMEPFEFDRILLLDNKESHQTDKCCENKNENDCENRTGDGNSRIEHKDSECQYCRHEDIKEHDLKDSQEGLESHVVINVLKSVEEWLPCDEFGEKVDNKPECDHVDQERDESPACAKEEVLGVVMNLKVRGNVW